MEISIIRLHEGKHELLDHENRKKIFETCYTKIKDSVPAQYAPAVRFPIPSTRRMQIEGTVIKSILTRSNYRKGRRVRDSIISRTRNHGNVTLNNAILDKDVILRENRQLVGHETYPVVIERKVNLNKKRLPVYFLEIRSPSSNQWFGRISIKYTVAR
jgi:glucose-1-phosphate adenylyltransferase